MIPVFAATHNRIPQEQIGNSGPPHATGKQLCCHDLTTIKHCCIPDKAVPPGTPSPSTPSPEPNKTPSTPSTPITPPRTVKCPNGYGLIERTHKCISLSSPPPAGTGTVLCAGGFINAYCQPLGILEVVVA